MTTILDERTTKAMEEMSISLQNIAVSLEHLEDMEYYLEKLSKCVSNYRTSNGVVSFRIAQARL